jgi:hypothetical protein
MVGPPKLRSAPLVRPFERHGEKEVQRAAGESTYKMGKGEQATL